jgi:hypothetical protein
VGEEGKGRDGTVQYVVSGSGKAEGRRQKAEAGGFVYRAGGERGVQYVGSVSGPPPVLSCPVLYIPPKVVQTAKLQATPHPPGGGGCVCGAQPRGRSRGLSLIHINLIHAVLRNVPPPHLYVPPAVSGYAVT